MVAIIQNDPLHIEVLRYNYDYYYKLTNSNVSSSSFTIIKSLFDHEISMKIIKYHWNIYKKIMLKYC